MGITSRIAKLEQAAGPDEPINYIAIFGHHRDREIGGVQLKTGERLLREPGETLDALIRRIPLPSSPGVHFTVIGGLGGHEWFGRDGRPLGDEEPRPRVVPGRRESCG